MRGVLYFLGNHPAAGVVTVIIAVVAFIFWEYIRMENSLRRLTYLSFVRWVAVSAGILSVVLMVSRFVAVAKL
jgi:hypothetical protein